MSLEGVNMKRKIIVMSVCILFIITVFPINSIAGDEGDPEIIDDLDDVAGLFLRFLHPKAIERIDINSTWFYEKSDDTETLRIVGKLNKVTHGLFLKSFYWVYWTFNGRRYSATIITRWYDIDGFVTDMESGESHMVVPLYDGDSDIFGFLIPKNLIGNPKQGDILTNTWSATTIGFGISVFIFGLAGDRAPDLDYGKDYIIQY